MTQAAPELLPGESCGERAGMYRMLAAGFLEPPTPERVAGFRDPSLLSLLAEMFSDEILEPLRAGSTDDAGEVRQEFMDLLKVPLGRYVPPYEAVHRESQMIEGVPTRGLLMGPSTVDVRRLYSDAGADLRLPELPDHIGVELSFLAFLCEEEEAARSAGDVAAADNYRAYQRGFLAEHVLRWVPEYCERLRQHSATGYFRALAAITPEFCRFDFAGLDGPS